MDKKLFVKNMVCSRCIKVIRNEVENLGITLKNMELGTFAYTERSKGDFVNIQSGLEQNGFEILLGQEQRLVEQIKIELIKLLQTLPFHLEHTLSKYLEGLMGLEYSKISKIFSMNENVTVEYIL